MHYSDLHYNGALTNRKCLLFFSSWILSFLSTIYTKNQRCLQSCLNSIESSLLYALAEILVLVLRKLLLLFSDSRPHYDFITAWFATWRCVRGLAFRSTNGNTKVFVQHTLWGLNQKKAKLNKKLSPNLKREIKNILQYFTIFYHFLKTETYLFLVCYLLCI